MVQTMDLRFPGRPEMIGTLSAASTIDTAALQQRLRADVFRGRIRLREFFQDFDPLRSGKCTEAKFRTAMDESGLKLTDPEMTELAAAFADPTDPKRVMYEQLLSSLEVFVSPGMETDPQATVPDFTPSVRARCLPRPCLSPRLLGPSAHRQWGSVGRWPGE